MTEAGSDEARLRFRISGTLALISGLVACEGLIGADFDSARPWPRDGTSGRRSLGGGTGGADPRGSGGHAGRATGGDATGGTGVGASGGTGGDMTSGTGGEAGGGTSGEAGGGTGGDAGGGTGGGMNGTVIVDVLFSLPLEPAYQLWSAAAQPSTWQHVVSGNFIGGNAHELFIFDPSPQAGLICSVGSSALHCLEPWRTATAQSPSLVVRVDADPGDSTAELLFYDRENGRGEFLRPNANGGLSSMRLHTAWRKTWHLIVSGNFSDTQSADELMSYDPTTGEIRYDSVSYTGVLAGRATPGFGADIGAIVAVQFDATTADDELLVYDTRNGTVTFFRNSGAIEPVSNGEEALIFETRTTWSHVMAVNTARDTVLFYDRTTGDAEIWSVSGGTMTLLGSDTWESEWDVVLAANFISSNGAWELFRYRRDEP